MKFLQALGVVFAILLVGSCVYFGPEIKQHFGERYADADREIFENSKPFVHGSIENLARLKLQYELSDNQQHKDAIRAMVVTQTATLDKSQLPYELRVWVESL